MNILLRQPVITYYYVITSTSQIEDRDTLKVIFLSTDDCNPCMQETAPYAPSCSSILLPSPSSTCNFDTLDTRDVSPCAIDSVQEVNFSDCFPAALRFS